MKSLIVLILSLTIVSGCSYSGTNIRPLVSWTGLVPLQKSARDSQWALDRNARVYVVAPQGLADDKFARQMTKVFKAYYPRTTLSQVPESLNQAFVSARYAGMDYVIYPQIASMVDQRGLGAVVREEIKIREFRLGEASIDIFIYASQGEELVDQLKLDTRGSVFSGDSMALLWPPLHEYLRTVSQFNLAQR